MKRIAPLETSKENVIYVETDDAEIDLKPLSKRVDSIKDQPPGSDLTSAATVALEAMHTLQAGLRDIVEKIRSGLAESKPSAVKLHVSVGFKGKSSPIPVILSGEADAALKLEIEWKGTVDRPA